MALSQMPSTPACVKRASELCAFLDFELRKISTVKVVKRDDEPSFCFRIYFQGNQDACFNGVSVSVPPDVFGNREGEAVETFETLLLLGDELIYVDEIGYCDVQRFHSMNSVLNEILRLNSVLNKVEQPSLDPK
jgi:hypothetical protein